MYDARDMDPVRPDVRPRSSVIGAWQDGWRRVMGAPLLVLGLALAEAWAFGWLWNPRGTGTWGPGAVFDHLRWVAWPEPFAFGGTAFVVRQALTWPELPLVTFWSLVTSVSALGHQVVWLALSGGALDRLARARPVGVAGFFTATGVLIFRLVRLAVLLGGTTWIIVREFIPLLEATTGAPGQSHPSLVAVEVALLGLLAIVGDVAQVRMAVEDRRSALSAVAAAGRFVARRAARLLALYVLNLVPAVAIIWLIGEASVATSGTHPDVTIAIIWMALVVEAVIRLGFMATAIAFFQNELAHAGYTARPIPTWPDSPGVEAIADLEARSRAASADRPLPL